MRNVARRKCRKRIVFSLTIWLIVTFFVQPVYANQDLSKDRSYVYKMGMEDVPIPDPYQFKKALDLTGRDGTIMGNPVDLFVTKDKQIFILDSDSGAVLIYDRGLRPVKIIDRFCYDGRESPLNKPEGIFVTEEGIIYIADTENNRIVASDTEGNISFIIEKPENLLGVSIDHFLPVKLAVDSINRVSVIARNINMGIMQFDSEGNFIGYTGAPTVKLTAMDRIWRMLSSQAQRAQMAQFVPTEYNNIKIDGKGFLWGTISSLSTKAVTEAIAGDTTISPVRKINSTGNDILKRKGSSPPVGDLSFFDSPSKIIDVALGPGEVYSLLDSKDGKIFTYNDEGNLLYVFGRIGNSKGNFERPVAIDYVDNGIIVLDNALSQLLLFELTDYGKTITEATEAYAEGEYSMSYQKWSETAKANTNFQYAFIGLGNAKMSEGKYKEAMDYFEYANYPEGYSKAKEMLRKEQARDVFPYLFLGIIGICLFFFINSVIHKLVRYAKGA